MMTWKLLWDYSDKRVGFATPETLVPTPLATCRPSVPWINFFPLLLSLSLLLLPFLGPASPREVADNVAIGRAEEGISKVSEALDGEEAIEDPDDTVDVSVLLQARYILPRRKRMRQRLPRRRRQIPGLLTFFNLPS
ncbi:unnamed protein product [Taenia asiatica]|uniref:Uncharacterized protein n=1 Tax=Taenia asiatica TaxID=60517 RepID=A0A0R3VVM9_TAEAS|nr:unnamed protein product [Taenia asiatica]